MNQLVEQIQKSIPEEADAIAFKEKAVNIGSFGYKGLNIDIYACFIHENEYLICASGLGHTLNISYLVTPNNKLTPEQMIVLAYDDFKDFIVYEREEHKALMH